MMQRSTQSHRATPTRGVATLTVVMILFFVMALVAAYTNRNLVFEQRISANSYRSARALDASEAGIDWTLSMLNGGRIDTSCASSNSINNNDFRGNYLKTVDISDLNRGRYETVWKGNPTKTMFPSCISKNGALSCICPTDTVRTPTVAVPSDGIGTAFNVLLRTPTNELQPGTLNVDALGCASIGTGSGACYNQSSQFEVISDAKSGVRVGIGLVQVLPVMPEAALTVGRNINGPGQLTAENLESKSASNIALIAGGNTTAPLTPPILNPVPDITSSRLVAAPNNIAPYGNWFKSRFGMDIDTFKNQPAVVTINCAAGCNSSDLADIHARFPRNPIWIEGNLTISAGDQLGSMPNLPVPPIAPVPATRDNLNDWNPIMLIVNGTLTVAANVRIVGFVHATDISWSSSSAALYGAMMSPGDFTATTNAELHYNYQVLEFIRLYYGSFVRVPGSWKQLNTIS